MLAHDTNFFDDNNSLAATTDANRLKKLSSISPAWQITGGSLSLTDVFEERYVPDYFSLHLTPSNTTDAVLVYLNNIAVPSVGRKITAGFHGIFYCESDISVTMRIGEQSLQIPDGRTTFIEQDTWANARSNLLEIPSNPSFSAVKFQALITGHQGSPIYFTMPVFYDVDGFKQNNFVQNGRNYIPTYYWDIDGQQENPSYPFYRVFDIFTSEANETVLSYVDFFEHEEDDRLPSDTDSTFTKSTLVNPYWVSDENRNWLAQFTGARLRSNVDSVARTYDSYERTTDTVTDDQLWGFMVEDGGFNTLQEMIDDSQLTAIEQDILEDWKDPVYPGGLGKVVTPSTHSPSALANNGAMNYLTSIDFNYIGTDYTTANTSYPTRTINIDLYDPALKKYTNFGGELTLDQRQSALDRGNGPSVQLDLWWDESKATELENLSGEVTILTPQAIGSTGQKKHAKMVGQKIDTSNDRYTLNQNRYSPDGDLDAGDINLNMFGSIDSALYDATGVDTDATGHKFALGVWDTTGNNAGYVKLATTSGKRIHPSDSTPEWTVSTVNVGLTQIGKEPRISYDGTTLLVQDDTSNEVSVCSIDWDSQSVTRIGDVINTGVTNWYPCLKRDGTAFFVYGGQTSASKIYDWDGTSWNARTMPDTSESAQYLWGTMSADGNTIAISYKTDAADNTTIKVRSFKWNGVDWTEFFGLQPIRIHNNEDATASGWNHLYGSSIAFDQTGTVCAVGAPGWYPEGHSTQNYLGAVYVYDFVDNGVGDMIWQFRAELSAKDDSQSDDLLASSVDSRVGELIDLSDNGKVVVSSYSVRQGATLQGGHVVWFWNSKTNSYNRSVAIDNDDIGAFYDRAAVAKAAAPIVDDEWFDVIKNHNLRFSDTTYQTGMRALAVNWGSSSGTNLDAFEATLDSLTRGDYIYIEDADNKIYRMRYAGGWSKPLYATSANYEQYPAKYNDSAGHQVHLIPYEERLEIVSGTGDGTPTATSFQGSPASRGTEWDGEIGQTLHFLTASTITNFFTTAQETDFINWQIQNSYYGHKSGSRESMIEAVRQVLTGDKVVAVSPNYSGLTHRIHLRTITAETSNVDSVTKESLAVLNAAAPTTPTGFYFTHETVDKLFFTLNNIGIGRLDVSVLG